MSHPVLLAVAHGSAHPQAAATVGALAGQVTRLAPVIDIRTAFVQHGEPSLADGLAAAGADVVIVPLLLSTGYHLTTDIAAAARAAWDLLASASGPGSGPRVAAPRVGPQTGPQIGPQIGPRVAGPLGPDPLLVHALVARLAEAGVPAGTPLVLAAAGSSDPQAAAQVTRQGSMLAQEHGAGVVVAFAASGQPTVRDAVADLRARTGGPVAVASYLLAPGHFQDRLAGSGADWVTAPLGDHPAVAALVIDRYRAHRSSA